MLGRRLREVDTQIYAVELLSLAREVMSLRELAKRTNISPVVLSRYIKGEYLPSFKRAHYIIRKLSSFINLRRLIRSSISVDKYGFINMTEILSNMTLLKLVTRQVIELFSGKRITKVVTIASDGIPLATHVATTLNVPLIYAKKTRELGISSFYEEPYVTGTTMKTLYLPRGLIRKADYVLVVDDIFRDGSEHNALIRILHERIRTKVVGFFVLIAIGEDWTERLNLPPDCEAHALLVLSDEDLSHLSK